MALYYNINDKKCQRGVDIVSIKCYKKTMKKKTKRIITSITVAMLLFVYYNYDYKYVPSYEIVCNQEDHCFAYYKNGKVYIVKDKDEVTNLEPDDIIIVDDSDGKDPDFKIISSYLINDKNIRNDIIEILFEYVKLHPSNWKRTRKSMRLEWFVHNFLYQFNYERNRTTDVDFNNQDEEQYDKEFYNKILKI